MYLSEIEKLLHEYTMTGYQFDLSNEFWTDGDILIAHQNWFENPPKSIDLKIGRRDRKRSLKCDFCNCLFKYQAVLNHHVEKKEIFFEIFSLIVAIFKIGCIASRYFEKIRNVTSRILSHIIWRQHFKSVTNINSGHVTLPFLALWVSGKISKSTWTNWKYSRMSSERNLFIILLEMNEKYFILCIIKIILRQDAFYWADKTVLGNRTV